MRLKQLVQKAVKREITDKNWRLIIAIAYVIGQLGLLLVAATFIGTHTFTAIIMIGLWLTESMMSIEIFREFQRRALRTE